MGIYVGTSSWTDPTLVRDTDFYPPGADSAEERLRYYASIFPVVEVDSTFYAPPSPDVVRLWVERTPSAFRMEIKSYGLFTGHPVRPVTIWKDLRSDIPVEHRDKKNIYVGHLPHGLVDEAWARFDHALRPLHDAGKLGAVVFQWPPWFTAKRANRERLEGLRCRLPDYRIAVEFRHGSWLSEADRDGTLALLEEHRLTYVCVDEPQGFKTSVPRSWPPPPRTWQWCASTVTTPTTGSARASPRRSGSGISTTTRSCSPGWRRSGPLRSSR